MDKKRQKLQELIERAARDFTAQYHTEVDQDVIPYLTATFPADKLNTLDSKDERDRFYRAALGAFQTVSASEAKDRIAANRERTRRLGLSILSEELMTESEGMPPIRITTAALLRIRLPYPWGPG
jgi:hypothetical protein